MGIALLSFAGFFMPLHSLAARWMPARKRRGTASLRYVAVRPACATRPPVKADHAGRPLRVVRMLDAQPSRSSTGRMVISGRMADVCAELDRLAALEESVPRH